MIHRAQTTTHLRELRNFPSNLRLPHIIPHTIKHNTTRNAPLLDNWHPLRRLERHARRIRRPRAQETHRGPSAHRELGNSCAIPSTHPSKLPSIATSLTRLAHPLVRLNLRIRRRAAKYARHVALHGGHEHVQRQYIPACAGSAAVQVSGAGDAVGRGVFDWRVGCAGGEGEAGYGMGEV